MSMKANPYYAQKRLEGNDIPANQALASTAELEKYLQSNGFWYTISRVVEGGLKNIRVKASLKVKT